MSVMAQVAQWADLQWEREKQQEADPNLQLKYLMLYNSFWLIAS